eukprot:6021241-Pyramimonas_sp.AAC.1
MADGRPPQERRVAGVSRVGAEGEKIPRHRHAFLPAPQMAPDRPPDCDAHARGPLRPATLEATPVCQAVGQVPCVGGQLRIGAYPPRDTLRMGPTCPHHFTSMNLSYLAPYKDIYAP